MVDKMHFVLLLFQNIATHPVQYKTVMLNYTQWHYVKLEYNIFSTIIMCFFSYCVYLFDKIISKIDTCIYKFISCSECIFVKYCVYFCIICTFLMFNSDGIFIIFIVFLNCVQAHIHRVSFFRILEKIKLNTQWNQ